MRIVTHTPERLEIEYKTWRHTLPGAALVLFLAAAMAFGEDLAQHQFWIGTLFAALLAALVLLGVETSRVALDRAAGKVTMFRKRAFRTTRLELPFSQFAGALVERVYWHEGWHQRIALVFIDGDRTWLIPASRAATRSRLGGVAAEINAWHGISTQEAEVIAGHLRLDEKMPIVSLRRWMRRIWAGKG